MKKISKYFKGVGEEVRRIRWPSKHLLWTSVLIVVCVSVISALSLLLCDFIGAQILNAFNNAFKDSSSTSQPAANLYSLVRWIYVR